MRKSLGLTLIFGKSFTGKTERLLHELQPWPRVVLVDPKCSQLVKLKGWEHVWGEFDAENRVWLEKDIPGFFQLHRRERFRVIVHFRAFHREQLELLCRLVLAVKNCVLAVDELGLFIPPGPAGALPKNITTVLVSGTHDGIFFCGTAQRPSLVHGTARANASHMMFYRIVEEHDLKVASSYLGSDWGKGLIALPNYVCMDWTDSGTVFVDYSLRGKLHRLPAET